MERIINIGNNLTWRECENAIDIMRAAESSITELNSISADEFRKVPELLKQETGSDQIDVATLFPAVLDKGLEFTAAYKILMTNNNVRESYEQDSRTHFRDTIFGADNITEVNQKAVEIRNLLSAFK